MTLILAAVAWLLTYLLHSTILLAGALVLGTIGVVRSQAAQDTLWKVALIGGLVTATAQVALRLQPAAGHVALASQPSSEFMDIAGVRDIAVPAPASAAIDQPAGAAFAAAVAAEPETLPSSTAREVRSFVRNLHVSWPAMILQVWLFGALAFAARLLWTRIELMRALRHRRELDDGPVSDILIELAVSADVGPPRLTVSDALSSPVAFSNEICLPERVLTRLSPNEQRAVLAHELGHVVRRDPSWLIGALAIESVFFFQPLNRFARRRLRATSEYLCDDWAAERTGGIILARCLAEVAGWVQGRPAPAVAAGMAGHCSHLVSRVERLLDGRASPRPVRWIVRAGAGALALAAVAWSVPGVAAEDVTASWSADVVDATDEGKASRVAWEGGDGWGQIRDGGSLLVFAPGYSARLRGQGRVGVRQWGRAIELTEGYYFVLNGRIVDGDVNLCDETQLRIVERGGSGAWELSPVRLRYTERSSYSQAFDQRSADELSRAAASLGASVGSITAASLRRSSRELDRAARNLDQQVATDQALGGEADAAIDTLLQLWMRDPETVRRAARRIARTYDRDLRPQFESLGVEVGRELAPSLQRLTDRVGRDLSPEFARLGAELGLSIVSALGEAPESGAGAGDYQHKKNPKH